MLEDILNRVSGCMMSEDYTAQTVDVRLVDNDDRSEISFQVLFSRDDDDLGLPRSEKRVDIERMVRGFLPPTYTVDEVESPLIPAPGMSIRLDPASDVWFSFERTIERNESGSFVEFKRADLHVGGTFDNRRI